MSNAAFILRAAIEEALRPSAEPREEEAERRPMSKHEAHDQSRSFSVPPAPSRGAGRDSALSSALKDLEAERTERRHKTERLRERRMAMQADECET